MVDVVAVASGSVVAMVGIGLIATASRYAREIERQAANLGPLRYVLVPPFVPSARAYAYLVWSARVGGTIVALVGVLFASSGFRSGIR